jgi:hypothetical protein
MTTHTVGNNVEAILSQDGEVVLVVSSFTSYVGLAGYFDAQRRISLRWLNISNGLRPRWWLSMRQSPPRPLGEKAPTDWSSVAKKAKKAKLPEAILMAFGRFLSS